MKDPNNVLQKALAKNEPVFVIRAQDRLSIAALSAYLNAARLIDESLLSDEQYDEIESIFNSFREWQNDSDNQIKFPD